MSVVWGKSAVRLPDGQYKSLDQLMRQSMTVREYGQAKQALAGKEK